MSTRSSCASAPVAVAVWDRLAPRYAWQERLERRAVDAALRLAAAGTEDRLVDLGCGTGVLLRRLGTQAARPASAVGVDRSTGMLDQVGPLPLSWRTMEGDARAVPLPDACAEVVTCTYLLHLQDPRDRSAVLSEARRLLAPTTDSRLVVSTVWCDNTALGGRLLDRGFRGLAVRWPATLGGLMPYDPTPDLQAAGFEVTGRIELPRRGYPSLVLRARPVESHYP